MTDIKRWTISIDPEYSCARCQTVEDPNGLWVDYRDHAAELSALREALEVIAAWDGCQPIEAAAQLMVSRNIARAALTPPEQEGK